MTTKEATKSTSTTKKRLELTDVLTDKEREAAAASLSRHARDIARLMTGKDQRALFALFGSASDARHVEYRSPKAWKRLVFFGVACPYRVAREYCALTELGLMCIDALRGMKRVK